MQKNALPFPFPLEQSEILRRRAQILTTLLSADDGFCSIPVRQIHPDTLLQMLHLYDIYYFGGLLGKKLDAMTVTLSSRLTSSAGKFVCTKGPFGRVRNADIRMSSDFLFRLTEGPFFLNGLAVSTPQEAFLIVFEHELCHAAETILFGSTGHSSRFLLLARGLFGHTATRHSLPTRRQEAETQGLKIGIRVQFNYQGSTLVGFVSYLGKAATVMVPTDNGAYRDRHGKRYAKYRVPLTRLKKA